MDLSYHFAPDPERAIALDRRMHDGLADSLLHIRDRAGGIAALDLAPLDRLIKTLGEGTRLPPAAFGWYFELGIALFDGQTAKAAEALAQLDAIGPRPSEPPIVTLDDPHVTRHGSLYLRRMGKEANEDEVVAPPPEMATPFHDRLRGGFALLDATVPELAAEVRALVHEILLATGIEGSPSEFDGASFYQLWGMLMLNPRFHLTPVSVAEVLAHESAHSLLFGFTFDEPLVLNPDADLYPSPLRRDLRPMDGIYHATFVSARMCWAMRRVADSHKLDSAIRATADASAERDARNFASGYSVVEEHGKMSEIGAALMAGARSYMALARH